MTFFFQSSIVHISKNLFSWPVLAEIMAVSLVTYHWLLLQIHSLLNIASVTLIIIRNQYFIEYTVLNISCIYFNITHNIV